MIRIGVGVEGPSDKAFWEKVLHRSFPGCLFKIVNLSGKIPLARTAPDVAERFRNSGYAAAFFLLDADKLPCASSALELFDESFRKTAFRQPVQSRFAHVVVAIRELESWVLADESCMRELLNYPEYEAPSLEEKAGGKARFQQLCREHRGPISGLDDRELAGRAGSRFSPTRARKHSRSFDYFWTRLAARIETARTTK
jgi:hypothetical protein